MAKKNKRHDVHVRLCPLKKTWCSCMEYFAIKIRVETSELMFLTWVVTEDITALICTLSYLLICSHCVWKRTSSNIAEFAFLCPISVLFGLQLFHSPEYNPCKVLTGRSFKSMNSALRWMWSEMYSSGCHILGSAMKKQKPVQVQIVLF